MDIPQMIRTLQSHPDSRRMGMIVSHLGIVRGTSRDGREVKEIDVVYDHETVNRIKADIRSLPGIVDILVQTNEGRLQIGDEVLAVVVGGDIREHVFDALIRAVNRIKAEASRKKEQF